MHARQRSVRGERYDRVSHRVLSAGTYRRDVARTVLVIVICSRHERLKGHLEVWMEVGQILNAFTSTELTSWRWWVAFGDDSDMPWKRAFARSLVVNSTRERSAGSWR